MMARPNTIVNLQDDSQSLNTVNLLVYGYPGCGKTPFLGTGADTLIMDCDGGGALSARASGSKADVAPITCYQDLTEVYEYLRDGTHAYRWVWWDSISLFQERTMIDELVLDAHMQNPRQDRWVPSKREYFVDHNRIMEFVRRFTELPMNFGVTAHVGTEYQTNDEGEEVIMYMPQVQGKNMPSKVSGYMNVVGLMRKRVRKVKGKDPENITEMLFQTTGEWFARDRFMKLPSAMAAPTIPKVEAALGLTTGIRPVTRLPVKSATKRSAR